MDVTVVYRVDLSSGHFLRRQVVWTSAVKYDSGICRPLSQITVGSLPSLIQILYCSKRLLVACGVYVVSMCVLDSVHVHNTTHTD